MSPSDSDALSILFCSPLPSWARGGGGGGVCSHHWSQGRSKHVLKGHASHRQLYWARRRIANIHTARTLAPNIPPALGSVPDATLDTSASLSHGLPAELFWDIWAFLGVEQKNRKRASIPRQAPNLRCQCFGHLGSLGAQHLRWASRQRPSEQ